MSRRAGMLAGLGVAGATLCWAGVTMLGLGVVLAQVAWLGTAIRLAGAAYLVWIGARMILDARRSSPVAVAIAGSEPDGWWALRRGYLASIANPKAAAFFGSVFVVMLPVDPPFALQAAIVAMLAALSAVWHCGLAVVFSAGPVQAAYRRSRQRIDSAVGAVLIALGYRMAAAR